MTELTLDYKEAAMKSFLIAALIPFELSSAFADDEIATTVTLRDSSVIKGTVAETTVFEGSVAFTNGVKLPVEMIHEMTADGTSGVQIATLANGDKFHFTPTTKSLAVATVLGYLSISLSNIRRVVFSATPGGSADGLIYYCTFDSPEAILKPVVGPAGKFLSGRFVEGKIGSALAVAPYTCAASAAIPAGFFGPKGCIEFWGRIDDTPSSRVVPMGCPCFFDCRKPNEVWKLSVMWNDNNGGGGGGLCGVVQHYPATTDHYGSSIPYEKYLGYRTEDWHHYALVWNVDGIASLCVQNGLPVRVAVFLDGKAVGLKTNVRSPSWGLGCFETTDMILGFPTAPGQESFNGVPYSIDEFKIWNYDKTDFAL